MQKRILQKEFSKKIKKVLDTDVDFEQLFLQSKNNLVPLLAFILEHKNGQPISKWVVTWLADAFEKYIYNIQGELKNSGVSLDSLLGLSGWGKRSLFKQMAIQFRDRMLIQEILKLHILGVTIETSIEAVADNFSRHLEHESYIFPLDPGEKKILKKANPIKAKYLKKRFFEIKKGIAKYESELLRMRAQIDSTWSPKEKNAFVQQYPLLNSGFKVT